MTQPSTAQSSVPVQPPHENGVDVFEVQDDEGTGHCLHRSRAAADACATWFGAEVVEVVIHD